MLTTLGAAGVSALAGGAVRVAGGWLLAAGAAHATQAPVASPAALSPSGGPPVLLVVGDSLSAEYGLKRGSGWVELLAQRLSGHRPPVDVANASISGDTTAGGRSRLPSLLARHRPAYVIIELGGNDALRGLDLGQTEANLRTMVVQARQAGARPMLIGMMMPPNYGKVYADRFAAIYRTVATSERVPLVPFLLAGVADHLELFQSDRIHPVEAAQPRLLDNVWPTVQTLIAKP